MSNYETNLRSIRSLRHETKAKVKLKNIQNGAKEDYLFKTEATESTPETISSNSTKLLRSVRSERDEAMKVKWDEDNGDTKEEIFVKAEPIDYSQSPEVITKPKSSLRFVRSEKNAQKSKEKSNNDSEFIKERIFVKAEPVDFVQAHEDSGGELLDSRDLIDNLKIEEERIDEEMLLNTQSTQKMQANPNLDDSTSEERLEPQIPSQLQREELSNVEREKLNTLFTCDHCDFSSKFRCVWKIHMKEHTKFEKMQCPVCKRYFNNHNKMKEHYKKTHSVKKSYKCKICPFSTNYYSSFTYHMRSHKGVKPYACSECEFKGVSRTMLTRHMRVHTGEKPFKCTYCDYKARAKGTLTSHLRIHTGERPFTCTYCEKAFASSSGMKKHFRTHSKREDFQCPLCSLLFKTKSQWQSHLESHGSTGDGE